MSLTDYPSRPFSLLVRLASLLRNFSRFDFSIFRLPALLRREKLTGKSLANNFEDSAFAAVRRLSDGAAAAAEFNPRPERENLIRRRWAETGIRMWNARIHGAGLAPLNIQGSVELLPAPAGETVRRYDKLEFRLVDGRIVCEGVVVDPPTAARIYSIVGGVTGVTAQVPFELFPHAPPARQYSLPRSCASLSLDLPICPMVKADVAAPAQAASPELSPFHGQQ